MREEPCTDHTPPWFVGHWRDWHRGHGCDRDDGEPRSAEATTEIDLRATNEASGFLTDTELRFLRAAATAGNAADPAVERRDVDVVGEVGRVDLLVRALDELAARRAAERKSVHFESQRRAAEKMSTALFDHSARTTKHFEPLLGYCVCVHCARLPEDRGKLP